ncbi:hypothetical protein EVC26_066 [Rhizobium phage RHph_I72]|nr:hypothetical protein EVC13_064 [Rhizobium phage RHph_I65]QIG76512.1 hypothetical protein EVC26_066 [Rhizobium phage RHph_I72]
MTVYVVQDHRRYDNLTGKYVSVHDLSPAEEYGQLRYLLTPTAAPWNSAGILNDLWAGLEDFGDLDYLLMVGNPVLCGLAAAVASEINDGKIRFLQWNGRDHRYVAVEAQVFEVDRAKVRG